MAGSPSPVDQLAAAIDRTGELVEAVGPGEWSLPTPCPGWTVTDLVDHLVVGHRLFAGLLRGGDLTQLRTELTAAAPEPDRPRAYRSSGEDLVAAFRAPGVLEQPVEVPIGRVPGAAALQLRIVEALVHGWDLSRATGRAADVPEALVEQALAFSRARLGDVPPGRTPFGPPQPVADDAPALDRLAALLGRSVGDPGA